MRAHSYAHTHTYPERHTDTAVSVVKCVYSSVYTMIRFLVQENSFDVSMKKKSIHVSRDCGDSRRIHCVNVFLDFDMCVLAYLCAVASM